MMTKAELAFSALDRDNKDNLVNMNIFKHQGKILILSFQDQGSNVNIGVAEDILCKSMEFVTRYCRAISLRKISRN